MEDTRPHPSSGLPFGDMKNVLERLLDEAEGGGEAPALSSQAPPDEGTPPRDGAGIGGGSPLGGLLSNPALLAALPTIMENLSPLLGNPPGGGDGRAHAHAVTRPHGVDRHTALLCAIKPYLSPRRQEAAETVIRLCRVWDALEKSGISVGDLLGGLGERGRSADVQ